MIKDSEVWTWGEKTASVVALASLKMCGVHTVGSTLMPYLKCMKECNDSVNPDELKTVPRLREFFRQVETKEVSNSRKKFTKPDAHFLTHL